MYEPLPSMPLHLASRASRIGDMAEALYWAVDELGLRLPARRDIARHAHVSEATISRRLRDSSSDEQRLVTVLVSARQRTYPPDWHRRAWRHWVPESDLELRDVRAWIACLAVATSAPPVAEAVCEAWKHELEILVGQLGDDATSAPHEGDPELVADAEAIQALLLGLSIKRLLDAELPWDRASMLLRRVVCALGHESGA